MTRSFITTSPTATFLIAAFLTIISPTAISAPAPSPSLPSPSATLIQTAPHLAELHARYPTLTQQLSQYARTQGYSGPWANHATVTHELIHIESATQAAFYINNQYAEPYLTADQWPAYSFRDYYPTMTPPLSSTIVASHYIRNAPGNTLANLADELNAQSQTTGWLCTYAPQDEQRLAAMILRDIARITNAYLATIRERAPAQYSAFYNRQHKARNALALIAINVTDALQRCRQTVDPTDAHELNKLIATAKAEARRR